MDGLKKLQRVVNSSIRIVECLRKTDTISTHLESNEWLTVEDSIELRIIMLIYTILSHSKPEHLASLLVVRELSKELRSNSSIQLVLPHVTSAAGARAFRVSAVKL